MSYRAVAEFWDGPDLYRPGDKVNLSPETLKSLERAGKVERIAEPSSPEKEPPAPSKPSRPKSSQRSS